MKEPSNNHLTTLEAKTLLEQDAQKRVEACQIELEQILSKHNCSLDVVVILKANQVIPQVQIVAKQWPL